MQRPAAALLLLISCGLVFAYYSWAYFGHFGFDDMQYARAAKELLDGNFDSGNHYAYRLPVVWATALAYRVFGINDFASALPAMLVTCVLLWGIYRVLKPAGNAVLTTGLALSVLSGWLLFNSNMLMPDQHVATGMVLALVAVHAYKFQRGEGASAHAYAIAFALALLYAFAAKGTVVLLLPLLTYLFIFDLFRRRDQQFWWLGAGYTLVGLVIYFGFTWWVTGDPFMRFRAIAGNAYIHDCSYAELPLAFTLKRIGYELLNMLFREGMLTGLVISLALIFSKETWWKFNDGPAFWLVCGMLMLLSSNFMSISPAAYSPMCVDPRHYLFLIPIGSIAGAYGIQAFWQDRRPQIILSILLGGFGLLGFILGYALLDNEYIMLLFVAGGYLLLRPQPWAKTAFLILLVAVLCLRLFNRVSYFRDVRYPDQRAFVRTHLLDPGKSALVLTDPVMKRWGEYYNGFKVAMPVEFISFQDSLSLATLAKYSAGQFYLLKNWHSLYLSEINWESLPYYVREVEASNGSVTAEQPRTNTVLYQLPDYLLSATAAKDTLLYSATGFEQSAPYWSVNEKLIQTEKVAGGSRALKADEFTGTFEFPLDSIRDQLPAGGNIIIEATASCSFSGPTTAVICVSVEDASGIYHYFTKGINDQMEAYTFFWPVTSQQRISVAEIRPNSTLKVYVWNKDRNEGFVDDFKVMVYGMK